MSWTQLLETSARLPHLIDKNEPHTLNKRLEVACALDKSRPECWPYCATVCTLPWGRKLLAAPLNSALYQSPINIVSTPVSVPLLYYIHAILKGIHKLVCVEEPYWRHLAHDYIHCEALVRLTHNGKVVDCFHFPGGGRLKLFNFLFEHPTADHQAVQRSPIIKENIKGL